MKNSFGKFVTKLILHISSVKYSMEWSLGKTGKSILCRYLNLINKNAGNQIRVLDYITFDMEILRYLEITETSSDLRELRILVSQW